MTQVVLAAVLGLLFAVGTFLVLRRDVVRVVWGVAIIGQAANVYLVTMGGLAGGVPLLGHGGGGGSVTDPLVQALVLTAIVIGFGTTAFALVLTFRVYETRGNIDLGDEPEGGHESDAAGTDATTPTGRPDGDTPGAPGTATDGGRTESPAGDKAGGERS
jgi:multicomponent Na+:H+ antiporter subunit C